MSSRKRKKKRMKRRLQNRLKKKEEEKKLLKSENITFVVDRQRSCGIEYFPKHNKIVTISRNAGIRFWNSENGDFITVIQTDGINESEILKWDEDIFIASHHYERIGFISVEKCEVTDFIPISMTQRRYIKVKLMKVGDDEFSISTSFLLEFEKKIPIVSFSEKKIIKSIKKYYGMNAIVVKSSLLKHGIYFSPPDWMNELEIRFVDWKKKYNEEDNSKTNIIIKRLYVRKIDIWGPGRIFSRTRVGSIISYLNKENNHEILVITLQNISTLIFFDTCINIVDDRVKNISNNNSQQQQRGKIIKCIKGGTAREQHVFKSLFSIRNDYIVGGNGTGDLNFFRLKRLQNYSVVSDARRFSVNHKGIIRKIMMMDHEKFSCKLLVLYETEVNKNKKTMTRTTNHHHHHNNRRNNNNKTFPRKEFIASIVNVHHIRLDPFDENEMMKIDLLERIRFLGKSLTQGNDDDDDDNNYDYDEDHNNNNLCFESIERIEIVLSNKQSSKREQKTLIYCSRFFLV